MSVLPHRWEWRERPAAELPTQIQKYLADTETKILGGQVHEASMLKPVAQFFGAIAVVIIAFRYAPRGDRIIGTAAILFLLFMIGRLAWAGLEWRYNLIFITAYRIIYAHGIVTRKIAMMPISKVTDMSYDRTPNGMLFRYGVFVIESAGQDQALRIINYVPDPDATYRYVQNLLFKKVPQDVSIVEIKTKKRLPVSWSGRVKPESGDSGAAIYQEEDPTSGW